jgi:hypothetical protein
MMEEVLDLDLYHLLLFHSLCQLYITNSIQISYFIIIIINLIKCDHLKLSRTK